jgi:hypothetical protein
LNSLNEFIKTGRPLKKAHCLIGFDGFIDDIVKAVDTRDGANYQTIPTISDFGDKIASFSGKSGNIELVAEIRKIGGNAPILTQGLLEGGHRIVLAATLGDPIDPVFSPLKERCEALFTLSEPGHSTAVEFMDGKVIFGQMKGIIDLKAEEILEKIPNLPSLIDSCDLVASVNWTMIPAMNALWQLLLQKVFPKLTPKKRIFFVDLADPAKRKGDDLRQALELLKEIDRYFEVHLGLNFREAERILSLFHPEKKATDLKQLAQEIKQAIGLKQVLIHSARLACDGIHLIETPFTEHPKLTTGAGDNFNAGYLNGVLYGMNGKESLQFGAATASYYVRSGKSPSLEELALFLGEWIN